MFSDKFYEKRLSIRERNMKLLLETVTYIAIKERVTCIITMETIMCIMYCRKYHLHNCNRDSHLHNSKHFKDFGIFHKFFLEHRSKALFTFSCSILAEIICRKAYLINWSFSAKRNNDENGIFSKSPRLPEIYWEATLLV